MSRTCDICGKGRLRGKLVPRLIGRRVSHRSITFQKPNLRVKRLDIGGGRKIKVKICASCLSAYKKAKGELADNS